MDRLVLYIGTSLRDIDQYGYLLRSIYRHNKDNLKVYTAVNDSDIDIFRSRFADKNVTFFCDSEVHRTDNARVDWWKRQQIIKMNFHTLGVCENFVQLDSDSFFIKDFCLEDFMFDSRTPYTLAHENKELLEFFAEHNLNNAKCAAPDGRFYTNVHSRDMSMKIRLLFGNTYSRFIDGGHPPCIWSAKVWKILEDYANDKGLSYEDLILHAQSEQQWYVEVLLKFQPIQLVPIQPMFKVFHYDRTYEDFLQKHRGNLEQGLEDLKFNYWGIGLQSNFSRAFFEQSEIYRHWFSKAKSSEAKSLAAK